MFFYWPSMENNPKPATDEKSNITLKKKKDLYIEFWFILLKNTIFILYLNK